MDGIVPPHRTPQRPKEGDIQKLKEGSSSHSIDHLLDETITIVPSTLSPTTFSTQVSRRLEIRSFTIRKADAATITNNMDSIPSSPSNYPSSPSSCCSSDYTSDEIILDTDLQLVQLMEEEDRSVGKIKSYGELNVSNELM